MSIALDGLIVLTGWLHVVLAPYTKVEESFNLHAVHDVLMYGVGSNTLHNYDHFTFPGAVQRTFVGSVALGWLASPVLWFAYWLGLVREKVDVQVIVRLVLATLNAGGLCLVRRSVSRRYGRLTGLFFTLLTVSQFHLPFWMGRTLPNMFALLPVNVAMSLLIHRAPNATRPSKENAGRALALLTFAAVVFRAELVLFLVALIFQSVLLKHVFPDDVVKVVFTSGLLSVVATVLCDSYFWDTYALWPELSSVYFNVIQGKSSEWGISPPLAYFTTHLPKLLLSSLPLSFVGVIVDRRVRNLVFPPILFLALISKLGHKEWRFIVYVVPMFNVAAARGARWMVSGPKTTFIGRTLFVAAFGAVIANLCATTLLTAASVHNYPGGEALALFHEHYYADTPRVHVHISNLAAQTGASLFLQLNAPPYYRPPLLRSSGIDGAHPAPHWIYDKTENVTIRQLTANSSITHLIVESRPDESVKKAWRVVDSVQGFDAWKLNVDVLRNQWRGGDQAAWVEGLKDVLVMEKREKLWILERK